MAKRVCISGYYGFNNFGDEGILDILISNLKKYDENIDITVFTKDVKGTFAKHAVNTVYTFDYFRVMTVIKNSDVLISGGGSLLQDSTSVNSLFYYLWTMFMAVFFKKKMIVFAQGIGPVKNPAGLFLTKKILKYASYLSVRDEKSLFLLRGWGLNPELVPDPMWNIELPRKDPLGRIGIQLRNWGSLTDKFLNILAREVVNNFNDKEIYIYSFQESEDLLVCKKLRNAINLLNPDVTVKLINNLSNEETIKSFRHLDCLIAMRYHACLLGAKYNIPVLPISYDQKVSKLADELGIQYLYLDEIDRVENLVSNLQKMQSIPEYEKVKSFKYDFTSLFQVIEEAI